MFRVYLIQLAVYENEGRSERFKRVEGYFELIKTETSLPAIIVLPEIWATGFFNFERYTIESEPLQGETYTRLAPWARNIGCYILAGSIIEKVNQSYYNTALMIGPDGTIAGSYRKIHLYGYHSQERNLLTPGKEILSLETEYGKWGVTTCYDLRFPELYRKLADVETEVLFTIAAWPLERLEHWLLLNQVRAFENLAYMVSCNCTGNHKNRTLGGNSIVVGPWGDVVARAGVKEEILKANIIPGSVSATRAEFPALQDRCIY